MQSTHLAPVPWFDGATVDRLLPVDTARTAVRSAFELLGRGAVPAPVIAGFDAPEGGFHWKAAWWPGPPPRFAAKLNANFPANPARFDLPTIQGHVALCDGHTGTLLAMMDSVVLTARRTAAATAVAAEHLARVDARCLAVVGCGVQGWEHVRALAGVRPLAAIACVDAVPEVAQRLARRCTDELGVAARAADLPEALRDADMVVTCTPSMRAFLGPDLVAPGTFVAGVGADASHKHELEPALLASATLVVDRLEQARTIGDLHHAIDAGVMTVEGVYADLGAIVTGAIPGRRHDDEVIVFDSTGIGLQDAAAAVAVYEASGLA